MVYIFDLDGTLALNQHRQHFLETKPRQWDAWNAACVNDSPNLPLVAVWHGLATLGHKCIIMTGRDAKVRYETREWLASRCGIHIGGDDLLMRPEDDHTEDVQLKMQWLSKLPHGKVAAVFEDRTRMVAAWREQGIPCWQVAPGDF
jgi:hypothetical protein